MITLFHESSSHEDASEIMLSVLIATIPERHEKLQAVLSVLRKQVSDLPNQKSVELITARDDCKLSVGAKRNALLSAARGKWLCFVDDDDMVAPSYLADILEALRTDPDCITFMIRITHDGVHRANCRFFTDVKLPNRPNSEMTLRRHANHLCPMRSSIAKATPFKDISFGEDKQWAKDIGRALLSEAPIDKILYHYQFSPSGSRTRPKTG